MRIQPSPRPTAASRTETFGTSGITGAPSLTTTATPTSAVGSYPITAAKGTLASTNYSFVFVDGTLTITKATALVAPNAASKVYGSADPTLAGVLSGFVAGDGVTASYNRTSGETVGKYVISATLSPAGALANYDVTYDMAIFEIRKKTASVTPHGGSKIYGSADPTFTGTLSGFLVGDGVTATYSRTSGEAVGTYSISATLSPAGALTNYDVTRETASFTITPATLNVTAVGQAKLYGSPDSSLTYEVSGLQFNDTIALVLTGALTRDPGERVGSYVIRRGTLTANGNYIINFTNGTLTIGYDTCLLYDPIRAVKSGATIPIKIQLCSASGANLSASSIVVAADELTLASTATSATMTDAGDANPDNNFRYDPSLGPGYIFNLKTRGLRPGTYQMRFKATDDPQPHIVTFQVR